MPCKRKITRIKDSEHAHTCLFRDGMGISHSHTHTYSDTHTHSLNHTHTHKIRSIQLTGQCYARGTLAPNEKKNVVGTATAMILVSQESI